MTTRQSCEEELKKASRRSRRELRAGLKNKSPELEASIRDVERVASAVKAAIDTQDLPALQRLGAELELLKARKAELKLGEPPRHLPSEDETNYRSYRDRLQQYNTTVDGAYLAYTKAVEAQLPEIAQESFNRYEAGLARSLANWKKSIGEALEKEGQRLTARIEQDQVRFHEENVGLVREVQEGRMSLTNAMQQLDQARENLLSDFAARYESYLDGLSRLQEDVDVEGVLRFSAEEVEELKTRVSRSHELAQLGITVEIVGHEFETLDAQVRRNLALLPKDVQGGDAFRMAKQAHEELMTKLRFLTPMKISGMRFRETIKGSEIEDYLRRFFAAQWANNRNTLVVTDAFRKIRIEDHRSRIYPVFINLVNNSLCWVASREKHEIQLDCIGDAVVISDSGPGVDPDDVRQLFDLYFTRRCGGRGIGLYLCRENLKAGGHDIAYASKKEHQLLPGANFVISFKGIAHG